MRKKQDRGFWASEADYIASVDPMMPGDNFGGDAECFARYCSMQEKWAKADGFPDLADEIRKLSRIRAIFRIDSKPDRM